MTINLNKTTVLRLKQQLDKIKLFTDKSKHDLAVYNISRHRNAVEHYNKAMDIYKNNTGNINSAALHKEFFNAVLKTQVDIDFVPKPEVDPNTGWVRFMVENYNNDLEELFCIDTQLMTLRFSPYYQGAMLGFEYKPRKNNFSVPSDGISPNFLTYFADSIEFSASAQGCRGEVSSPHKTEVRILSHTQDLLQVLFKPLEPTAANAIFKHYKVKAGLGAHLPNSTTGFSMRYWFDYAHANPAGKFLVLEMNLLLPTGVPGSISAQALMSVGGVDSRLHDLNQKTLLDKAPGGLHGIRLIDGLDNFVMDIRSAQRLVAVLLHPLFDKNNIHCGTQVKFYIKTDDVGHIDKANTIFVSIV